jgi:1-acyl-sn-glycerol-3-phosphate acyltransferase
MQTTIDAAWIKKSLPIVNFIRRYHRHRIVGLEHIPLKGPGVVVINHSWGTYDSFLLLVGIFLKTGRWVHPLGDRWLFRIPGLREAVQHFGVVEGEPRTAKQLLKQGHLVMVAPGGMREALRPSSERYQLRWQERRGFVKLAMQAQVPIILAACPKADDLYTVYVGALTKLIYKYLKLPAPLFFGLGCTWFPRPVQLTHWLSKPILPPPHKRPTQAQIKTFHAKVTQQMQQLMQQ